MKAPIYIAMVLVIVAAAARGEQSNEARAVADSSSAARTVRASSGRCVGLTEQEAAVEAEQKAGQCLRAELSKLAEELAGRKLTEYELTQQLVWLYSQPGVERKDDRTVDRKPYGPVVEHSIRLQLPQSVIRDWATRLAARQKTHRFSILAGAAATVFAWLGGLAGAVRLDRATGGYYRSVLLVSSFTALSSASVIGWAWLIWVM
ncbi:MAG: hypothetical protein KatS3mg110_1063 [Pirellulaceae bacterium]|nr:MAG: hypothetical protein KatS3mg110_1063 [Pirellulaceae bacterium]